jgi:hypothetical protein
MQLRLGDLDQFFDLAAEAETTFVPALPDPTRPAPVHDVYYEQIRSVLRRDGDALPRPLVWSLAKPIEIAVWLGRQPADAISTFQTILDAIRQLQFVASLDERNCWVEAIQLAKRHRLETGYDVWGNRIGSRASTVARSLLRLRERGFDCEVNAFGAGLTTDSLENACAEIDQAIRRIGGDNVAQTIFTSLRRSGKTFEGLFLAGRITSQLDRPREPSIPWHFLYNLALKHLGVRPSATDSQREWKALIELSKDVAASLDVEEYSAFAGMSVSPYLIHREILDNTFYDELFGFQQWRADGAANLFIHWVDALVRAQCPIPILSAEVWKQLGTSLIAKAQPTALAITTPVEHASFDMSAKDTASILERLAVPVADLNAGYSTPLQTDHRIAPFFPLIAVRPNAFVLPPRGLAARGLYERFCTLMRDTRNRHLERKLGQAFEFLTEATLRAEGHEPSVVEGKYDHPTLHSEFEMDFAFESEEHVTLIECKLKALRRSSRGPAPLDALSDLTQSFLASQIQMARHEIALKTLAKIRFKNGQTLSLNGRKVERISLTMLDHGSLQDKLFTKGIIQDFVGVTLNSEDPRIAAGLGEFNADQLELQGLLQELARMEGEDFGRFLLNRSFGTWWLSVDQLALFARSAPSLPAALNSIRNITFQTGDIMSEYAQRQRMDREAAAAQGRE